MRNRVAESPVVSGVVAIAVAAVLARLGLLGVRLFQYDEGWVGYWILRYASTGVWEYRPLVHGPFLFHANRLVFSVLGATDVTARLVVAFVGGLLPLSVLALRHRLGDGETVVAAALLAFNPILLYYSRFMRSDVLLATFAAFAFVFLVRAADTGSSGALVAGAAALALAFTTKESAVLYPLVWVGATALVLDAHVARRASRGDSPWIDVVSWGRRAGRGVGRQRWAIPGAVGAFLGVIVLFYAPRTAGSDGLGLWAALDAPERWPALLGEATLGSAEKAYDFWVSGGMQDHAYLPYLLDYLATLAEGAPVVAGLAVVGFLVDRYTPGRQRDLVALTFYWGVASAVGYPLVNAWPTPWSTVHAVVPLAIPAAVGVAAVVRWAVESAGVDAMQIARFAAASALFVAIAYSGATAVETSYRRPNDAGSQLVYHNQLPADLGDAIDAVGCAARSSSGVDVAYYGSYYALANESVADRPPAFGPEEPSWHWRLPLPWYVERAATEVVSVESTDRLERLDPAVVITRERHRAELSSVGDYATFTGSLGQDHRPTAFLVRRSAVDGTDCASESAAADGAISSDEVSHTPIASERPSLAAGVDTRPAVR